MCFFRAYKNRGLSGMGKRFFGHYIWSPPESLLCTTCKNAQLVMDGMNKYYPPSLKPTAVEL